MPKKRLINLEKLTLLIERLKERELEINIVLEKVPFICNAFTLSLKLLRADYCTQLYAVCKTAEQLG